MWKQRCNLNVKIGPPIRVGGSTDRLVGQLVLLPPWRFGFVSQAVGPGLNAPGFYGTRPSRSGLPDSDRKVGSSQNL